MMKYYQPPKSKQFQAPKKKISIEFDVDGHKVVAAGSQISGKEMVYVDGELVSEKQTYKKNSSHQINIEGVLYDIKFIVTSYLFGKLKCHLVKNDEIVQGYLLKQKISAVWLVSLLIMSFLISFALILGIELLSLPTLEGFVHPFSIIMTIALAFVCVQYQVVPDPDVRLNTHGAR